MPSPIPLGVRSAARRPGLLLSLVLILGASFGLIAAAVAIIDSFVFRSLPFPDGGRLVWLKSRHGDSLLGVSHADYLDWAAATRTTFQGLAIFNGDFYAVVSGTDLPAESILVTRSVSSLFPVLGIQPLLGRTPTPAEDQPDAQAVALVGEGLWRRHFGRDPGVLGRTVTIDGLPHVIIGVMPQAFRFPSRSEIWVSTAAWNNLWPHREVRVDSVVGRLLPGVSLLQGRQALAVVSEHLAREYPDSNAGITTNVERLRDVWAGDTQGLSMLALMASAALLVVVMVNASGLFAVRLTDQLRPTAIRQALGMGPWRSLAAPLVEGLLVGLAGSAVALAVAALALRIARRWMFADLPAWMDTELSVGVAALTVLGTALAGLILALPSALAARVLLATNPLSV